LKNVSFLFLAWLVLFLGTSFASTADIIAEPLLAMELIVFDDFENGAYSGVWNPVSSTPGEYEILGDAAKDSSFGLRINGRGSLRAPLSYTAINTGRVDTNAFVKTKDISGHLAAQYHVISEENQYLAGIAISEGRFKYYAVGGNFGFESFSVFEAVPEKDKWYLFRIVYNEKKELADFYVYDEESNLIESSVGNSVALKGFDLAKVEIGTYVGGSDFDNVGFGGLVEQISTNTPPRPKDVNFPKSILDVILAVIKGFVSFVRVFLQ